MKTSNKLLLGLLIVMLSAILSLLVFAKVTFKLDSFELSGLEVTVEEKIEAFQNLQVSGGLKIYFTQGEPISLRMEGDSALVARVKIEQSGDKLSIKLEGRQKIRRRVKVYLQNPELSRLNVVAGSKFVSENTLNINNLDVEVVAGGDAEIEGAFNTLEASATAGGIATLSGTAERVSIQGTAGGIVHAYDLACKYGKVEVVAGSIVEIFVTDELQASATAGGIVRYKGAPKLKDVNVSAGGSIKNKE